MSSKKKLCLRSDSQKRQSFDERICDDLCEVILQYLSLEDKLRLECVSKQFKRTIFRRHYELYISWYSFIVKCLFKENGIDLKSLESLLKKCFNLRKIWVYDKEYQCNNTNEIIESITKYCNYLNEFYCDLKNEISDQTFNEFHTKFRTKLKEFNGLRDLNELISYKNIEYFVSPCFGSIESTIILQLNFRNLKKLILRIEENQLYLVHHLLQKSRKLLYLWLSIETMPQNDETNDLVVKAFKGFPNIEKLIQFRCDICKVEWPIGETGLDFKQFCDILELLAKKCLKLKQIRSYFDITLENPSFLRQFSLLKAFKALKRLDLSLYSNDIDINGFSFEAFKNLSNLTHLRLWILNKITSEWQTMNGRIIKDIDIHLPRLQYLVIGMSYVFEIDPKGVTQMADTLSRLSRLEKIVLLFKSGVNYEPIKEKIIEKCRKIKSISLRHL